MSGTANAAYSSPPASTTDWFGLDLVNNPGNQHFEVCDYQSSPNRIFVAVADDTYGGAASGSISTPAAVRDGG